ncbi:phosphotransferase [Frankia sp. CNm7]|uniref:Phosphotransferase n=1 Tax=Frankia nepalensis TaxID=1836974 RepID=A0A937UUH9_9ACTN|nr:aminoglycoside phosphotransferase family protein [Frankia nepalensis]MBL7495672.1 phosphotransferase [Frankia nepalensis]MBL7510262.1 phosphotransferase [Frankia nepalensis]MBL7520482.1 phosphotransferase [Frankia nepalensis]MBL7631171.1 phosphotransferase [Frankia nepalensis]
MNSQDELLGLCQRYLDPESQEVRLHLRSCGTAVLEAVSRHHGDIVIKTYTDRQRHGQETHAYRTWVPVLRNRAPKLLCSINQPAAIVITAVSGHMLNDLALGPADEQDAHRRAGEILRTFHSSGPPRAEPDWTTWLAERADYWLAQAADRISARQRLEIQAHMRALQDLAPVPAVPCHLDFTPRNLIRADDGAVHVIDFEHSRYDLAARDLVRLATRIWPARPDLRSAFLDGYGDLTTLDEEVIEHCRHLDVLTSTCRDLRVGPGLSRSRL